ncbi:hypothetical protein C474_08772 [Halogeometricum pallidum JCM 14848]|uniref:Uncharacterized protein n=1 Tax=Halogeometricum pallidum JCM 14848 TaxID=1227487 RepID=M0D9I9_HALPD|nr:hypothetical protein [Halogeometricum pallidum]ELZ31382.1 hypothetical protein C474_08772 [Halogeometricum pallidum JCM 14848]
MTEQPSLEALQEQLTELEARVTTLEEENQELKETVDSQREKLDEYREELDTHTQQRDAAADHRKHLQQRLHALESETKDTETTPSTETRSPLQQLVGLPSKLTEKLTANQERARFIAQDIQEYATKVPAGFAIDSARIRRILNAKEGRTPHTQTVTRVMEFLDRLGKDDVQVIKRRGTKRVIFTERAVSELAGTSESSPRGITGVVTGWT